MIVIFCRRQRRLMPDWKCAAIFEYFTKRVIDRLDGIGSILDGIGSIDDSTDIIGLFKTIRFFNYLGTFWAPHNKRLRDESRNLLFFMVGVIGFEPTTPCSQSERWGFGLFLSTS